MNRNVISPKFRKTKLLKFFILILSYCFLGIFTDAFAFNLNNLKSHFLQGDYGLAITEGERLLASAPAQATDLDLLYYFLGISYLKSENYLRASDIFEIILEEFPDSRLKEEVRLGLGDSYFLRQKFANARTHYQEILTENPNFKYKALVYHRLSQAAFKEGNVRIAAEYLDKLKREFPQGYESLVKEDVYSLSKDKNGVYYSVQVGSFIKDVNARKLAQKLMSEGYSAYIEEAPVAGGTKTYRVKVGKVSGLNEAQQLVRELARKGYPTKICP